MRRADSDSKMRELDNELISKDANKQGQNVKHSDNLDKCLNEIITKRMARGSNQVIEIADTRINSGMKILEQEYTESVGGNLYVGNLHPKTTEETLFREFCKYGPIESLKIMYPRTAEERSRGRNCGFVKFIEREDAELAMEQLEDIVLFGYEMKLGWGKAMPKSTFSNAKIGYLNINNVSPGITETANALMMNPTLPKIYVEPPVDESERTIIDCVSRVVASVSTI
jgi:RNA recognition motif-containing protein